MIRIIIVENTGFVLVGRSLRGVENREDDLMFSTQKVQTKRIISNRV